MLDIYPDNFFTRFPQKMWKTLKSSIVIKAFLIVLCLVMVSSCSYFKGGKKQDKATQDQKATEAPSQTEQGKGSESSMATPEKKATASKEAQKAKPVPDSSVIDMTESEVKKKFGEPDIVSKMSDSRILWTYHPTWKLMPDNKGTVYIEFENGKVAKIIRSR